MTNSEYRFKFYLNARHEMDIDEKVNNIHPHTWEFNLFFKKNSAEFIQFSVVERELQFFLSIYEGNLINEIPPFDQMEPSLENIGTVLYEQIKRIMGANKWILLRLEISESPSRTYIIYEDNPDLLLDTYRDEGSNKYLSRVKKMGSRLDREQGKKKISNESSENVVLKNVVNGQNIINFPQKQTININGQRKTLHLNSYKNGTGEFFNNNLLNNEKHTSDNHINEEYAASIEECSESKSIDLNLQDTIHEEALSEITSGDKCILQVEEEVKIGELFETGSNVENSRISRKDRRRKSKRKRRRDKKKNSKSEASQVDKISFGFFKIQKKLLCSSVFRNIMIVFLVALILIVYITSKGYFPWGSDTWGHLFKSHLLYEEFMKGNFYPEYTEIWYNGVQPFRYWAPLPYYILMVFEIFTKGNTILSYNMFIVFSFILGAFGWILWGRKTGRNNFALALALMWFFMPDNARVFFSEGNIPRVVVTSIFPFLLLNIWDYVENRKKSSMVMITIWMLLITLSHAMIAAMSAITITVFIILYGVIEKKKKNSFEAIFAVIIGIALSGFWLYPALKGGIVSMDSEAVGEVMESLTYPLMQSLNSHLMLKNPDIFYFGLSVFIIALLGIVFGSKKSKSGFIVTLGIMLGTTKALLFLFQKLPMSQLFWMKRFVPLAYGVFFVGLLLWKKPRRGFVLLITLLLITDCWLSVRVLCKDVTLPRNLISAIEPAVNIASQRVAVLDSSEFGSFPSYFLAYNEKNKTLSQVYGWAWQGAKTSENIVWINTALDKGWYTFMFDRCLEIGADTLIVKKDKILDKNDFLKRAADIGYAKIDENNWSYVFKYPVYSQFGSKVIYSGMGIGKYASNLSYIFPEMKVGKSEYLDSYSIEELENYKVLFLSGFKYRDKTKAEEIVKAISKRGVKVIIDMTGMESELSSSRAEFLDVIAQPVLLKNTFPTLEYGSDMLTLNEMPEEYKNWNTIYIENLDNSTGKIEFENQYMNYLGNKINENITFIGLNLPFYGLLTKDRTVINLLEDITGMKAEEKPDRRIVKVDVKREGDTIKVSSEEEEVIIGMAYLDAFNVTKGNLSEVHNIIKLEGTNAEIRVITPHIKAGVVISLIGIIMLGGFVFKLSKESQEKIKPTVSRGI